MAMDDDDSFNHYVVEYIAFRTANEPGFFPCLQSSKQVYKGTEVQLARWIERMNRKLNNGTTSVLTEQRAAILSEIGFPRVEQHDKVWGDTFDELEEFYE